MAISESTLRGWTHQGAIQSSSAAYASVKAAIESSVNLRGKSVDVFLQGSYKNTTNTHGESDVDVVVRTDISFFYDLAWLQEPERTSIQKAIEPATYTWAVFRSDVLDALVSYYGSRQVSDRNKCITISDPGSSGISADVIPAFTHRLYIAHQGWLEGVAFLTQRENVLIVNFPKQHYERGVEKQAATDNFYKPTVRMFKNARTTAIERGFFAEKDAPSYFTESLIYNAPNSCFSPRTWEDTFVETYNAINSADWSKYTCANGILYLFGDALNQWNQEAARKVWAGIAELWTS